MKLLYKFFFFIVAVHAEKFLTVKGRVFCSHYPAFNTLVRLWPMQEEKGYDVLAEQFSDQNGTFLIKGKVFTDKNYVVLKIYHDCADGLKKGQRKFVFRIPTKYASSDENAEPYEFGDLNLETKFKYDEDREEADNTRRRRELVPHAKTTTDRSQRFDSPEDRIDLW